jgi:hypothetical protein
MPNSPHRPSYQPSGGCDTARFPQALAVLAVAASLIAAVYCGMIFIGVYISALSVFVPLMIVVGGSQASVERGHWRNPVIAGALGAMCGLTGYLGYFHADQCLRWGVPWTAIDRLPGYVAFRMETDQWQRMSKGANLCPQQPAPGVRPQRLLAKAQLRSWNWAGFAFEALVLSLVPLATSVTSARVPYSERRRRWCSREQLTLAPNDVAALRRALAEGGVDRWVDSRPRKVRADQPHGKVSVWYTPAEEGKEADPDVYVTVETGRPLLLLPEEAAAMASLLPGLQDLAGPTQQQLAAAAEQSDDPASARVWPLPAPYAGQAECPRNRLLTQLACRTLGLLPFPLVILLLPGGVWLVHKYAVANNLLPMWVMVVYVLGVGFSCVPFIRWWYRPGQTVPFRMCIFLSHRFLRQAIADRPQSLVATDDPRAVFCEMLPRRFWGTGKAKPGEYNNGLLLVDADKGGIRFEGDQECYWIPAAAVLKCEVEVHPCTSATTAGLWAVVLRVRLGGGTWEFPFFPLANIEAENPWERATNLMQRIQCLCGRDFSDPSPAPPSEPKPTVIV